MFYMKLLFQIKVTLINLIKVIDSVPDEKNKLLIFASFLILCITLIDIVPDEKNKLLM